MPIKSQDVLTLAHSLSSFILIRWADVDGDSSIILILMLGQADCLPKKRQYIISINACVPKQQRSEEKLMGFHDKRGEEMFVLIVYVSPRR